MELGSGPLATELFLPIGGGVLPYVHTPQTHPINTPQTVLPHWGYVYCSSDVFVHSIGFYALVILGDPEILSVLVCLASVCIRNLRRCFIIIRFYP